MSSGLDPVILAKLEAFSRRRRKLIILRGIFAALAMLLATMMVVALVDYIFVLPDWVRWSLSGAAYLAVLITEWRACLRLLVHAPDPRILARLIEHAEPKLREDLISAVELGQSAGAFDSEQFRQLVQADVASRMEAINMDELLPVQLLRRTIVLASVVAVACIAIFAASGFQFGTLLIRAMLPMANLARVSKVKVNIVEPSPAEGVVPQGDSVPLIIEITGQRTNKAVLETFTESGGREIVQMIPAGPDRFSANIQVARDDIAYRVRAGDALTRKYQLHASARPHVVRFQKNYRFPDYVKLPEKQVTEENGDLAALEGTQVTIRIETDQAVKTAELRMDQGKQSQTIPLRTDSDGKLSASVPLQAQGYYRVHLVAAKTGFENKFSPEYEIRPEADLVPTVELELPRQDAMFPSNEIVDIRGTAGDDYGLAKVSQLIRVNDGAWKEIPLSRPEGKQVTVERRWDLYEQGVRSGDLITTKLLAVDLKGSRAESRPVQITVTSSGFESKRMTSLEDQRQLLVALKTLRAAGDTLEKRANESRDQMDRLSENDPQRKQALVSFTGALDDFERAATSAVTQLQTTLRGATPGHATGEYVMLGRLLARMWGGAEQNARDAVNLATANETLPSARELVRDAVEPSGRAAQRARQAEESARVFVTSEAIDVLNESLQVVAREQERVSKLAENSGEDLTKWAQVVSRLRVVLSQTRGLGEVISATAEHATDGFGDRLRRVQKEFDKQRTILESTLNTGAASKELLSPVMKFAKATGEMKQKAFEIKRDYMGPPGRAFHTMLQEAQPTWANFEKLRQEIENIGRSDRLPEGQRSELNRARWEAKASVLKAHGDAEESRPDSDAYFVSDVRAATLALNGLQDAALAGAKPFTDVEKTAVFVGLDKAFRLLESAHNLAETHEGLTRLATAERWEITALRARTANPRDWEWIEARLRALPDELGRTQLNEEPTKKALQGAQKILREAQGDAAWRNINEEMKQRLRPEVTPRAMPQDAEHLAAFVQQALELLREPAQEARKFLAQSAPKLSEMMAQLAKKAEKMRSETAEQAQQVSEKAPDRAQSEARQQLAEQQQLNRDVDTLKDLLRSDANKQNMLEQEGRERARDADDALAMLKDPPPNAEEALSEAAASTENADRQQPLEKAATEQQKIADALKQLAQHYDALEQGNAEQTRLALRDSEKALGTKDAMDQRYARAEQLAQMAQATPEEMLKQLEKALPQNPLMQQELSGISKNVLSAASEKLADASQRENAVSQQVQKLAAEQQTQAAQQTAQAQQSAQAQQPSQQSGQNNASQTPPNGTPPNVQENPQQNNQGAQQMAQAQPPNPQNAQANQTAQPNQPASTGEQKQAEPTQPQQPTPPQAPQAAPPNPQLAQAAGQQAPIAQATNEAGMDVARAGRHEQRLQNSATGQKLEQLGDEIRETGTNEIPAAQQALQSAQTASQAQAPVSAAQNELQKELGQLAQTQTAEMAHAESQAGDAQQASQQPQSTSGQQRQQQAMQPSADAQKTASNTPNSQQPAQPSQQEAQNSQASPSAQQPQMAQNQQAPQPNESGSQEGTPTSQIATTLAAPQEQVWMARTLDALDAALHDTGSQQQGQGQEGQQGQQAQQGNQSSQSQQPSQNADAMAKAQQAMKSAAQAATAAMRATRSQQNQSMQPSSAVAKGDQQAESKTGATADGGQQKGVALPGAQTAGRAGDWGKLPKKVAEQLTQGQRETVAGEYRNQVETYYRVIAERAKKP